MCVCRICFKGLVSCFGWFCLKGCMKGFYEAFKSQKSSMSSVIGDNCWCGVWDAKQPFVENCMFKRGRGR